MTWRRIAPWLIGAIALVAIFIDLPRTTLGLSWLPDEIAGVEFRTVLGLDLQGGLRVTLEAEAEDDAEITDEDVALARDIIERRVAGIGVSEPQVRTETAGDGSRRIVVEVPGVSDENQVRDLVGSTGQLQFIDPQGPAADARPGHPPPARGRHGPGALQRRPDPAGQRHPRRQLGQPDRRLVHPPARRQRHLVRVHDGERRPAGPDRPRRPGHHDARRSTARSARAARSSRSAPPTPENEIERTSLYNTLRFGALPLSLTEIGFDDVDPTLGADFLVQALVAGAVGLLLVLIFMVAYYRLPGVLAAVALVFYTLVVYAVFRLIHVTLTLAGVAAFILSIGMAVDANILIFERMKEEIRAGKTLGPAIEAGFNRAWSSILDSNVSSLLVAGWLYWQGTTVVKGFALVLIIGVLVSMFSAVTVTRTMLRYVTRTSWGRRLELYHVER